MPSPHLSTPKVSIIMPIWNVAAYVQAAVRSILEQSLADWELIVVDDHSEDGSDWLVEAFGDPRIRLLRQTCHAGIVAALNRAASEARADYIARMDGDDVSHPDRLQRQLAFMHAHPGLDLVGTDCLTIDEAGAPVARVRYPVHHAQLQRVLRSSPCLHHGTWMLKRAAFVRLGGYRFDHAEDYDFLTRADTAGLRLGNLAETLYSYREHADNTEMRKGDGLRQIRTHIHIQKLYRRRRRGLPESGDDGTSAGLATGTPLMGLTGLTGLMEWLHHAAFRIVRKSHRAFPKSPLRFAGYAVGCVLSPYVAYRLFSGLRQRMAPVRVRFEPVSRAGVRILRGGSDDGCVALPTPRSPPSQDACQP